jgi:hypothetical protein
MSMLRNNILALRRAGAKPREIAEQLEVDEAVVNLALEALGGSAAVRRQVRAEDAPPPADILDAAENSEEDDVSKEDSREMLKIIKGIALNSDAGPYAQLNAAKYIHGVRAGYHKKHLELDVSKGGLLLQINAAYANAHQRAVEALKPRNVTPEIEVK